LVCPTLESPKHFFDCLLQERPFEDLSCEEKKSWEKIEIIIVSPKYFDLVDFNQIAIHQITILQQSEIQLMNNTKLQVRSKKNKYE
jgi:hypothetical protein